MSCCKGKKCRRCSILCRVAREGNAVGVQSCVVLQGKEMPEALDKGSQPYSRAVMYGEMAGEGDTHTHKTLL